MQEPQIKELPYARRKLIFSVLVVVFLLALPALIFYSKGYRLSFEEETSIVSTGGVYVTTDDLEVDVYLDDELVEKPRLFRSAYYIQNVNAGQHRVVVQRPDLTTWVKELPVDPHIVIEAAAFNMPAIPHVRPVTEFLTPGGELVYPGIASSSEVLGSATTTVPVIFATSTRTAFYELNSEYVFVKSLFSTTSTSSRSVFERLLDEVERFRFATTTPLLQAATTTEEFIERGNIRLVERGDELYAVWLGAVEAIPFYFCVTDEDASTTAKRYGQHVADQVEALKLSTTTPIIIDSNRLCRPEIKLDRLRKDVYFYDFFPNSSDLVLLQLDDGLYVTEIDDRAWQNVQLLYPGSDFLVVVENDEIYIQDRGYFFEVVTEIELQ